MEKMVKEKKILYDHDAKQEDKKYTGRQNLVQIDTSILPNYIKENLKNIKSG